MLTGVCDLFDGFVARRCKRTDEEKQFGIQLDSLVDVFSFDAFPVVLLISLGFNNWYHIIVLITYAIFGVARLGYFNIKTADSEKAVDHYDGLPITFAAIAFPIIYLLSLALSAEVMNIVLTGVTLIIGLLFVSKIKIKKPRGIAYALLSLLAISVITLYILFI